MGNHAKATQKHVPRLQEVANDERRNEDRWRIEGMLLYPFWL